MGNEVAAQADFSFVHVTDTHIMVGGKWKAGSEAWEFDTNMSLQAVVATINTLQPRPAQEVRPFVAHPERLAEEYRRRLQPDAPPSHAARRPWVRGAREWPGSLTVMRMAFWTSTPLRRGSSASGNGERTWTRSGNQERRKPPCPRNCRA